MNLKALCRYVHILHSSPSQFNAHGDEFTIASHFPGKAQCWYLHLHDVSNLCAIVGCSGSKFGESRKNQQCRGAKHIILFKMLTRNDFVFKDCSSLFLGCHVRLTAEALNVALLHHLQQQGQPLLYVHMQHWSWKCSWCHKSGKLFQWSSVQYPKLGIKQSVLIRDSFIRDSFAEVTLLSARD